MHNIEPEKRGAGELPWDWFNLSLLHWREIECFNIFHHLSLFSCKISFLCTLCSRFVFVILVTLGDHCPRFMLLLLRSSSISQNLSIPGLTNKHGTCVSPRVFFLMLLPPPCDSSLVLLIQTRTEYQIIMIRHISDLRYLRQGDKSSEKGEGGRVMWPGRRKLDCNEWNVGS